jgi:hypothetical protein
MTLAHAVPSGANCVAEPGRLRSFENRSTLPPAGAPTAKSGCGRACRGARTGGALWTYCANPAAHISDRWPFGNGRLRARRSRPTGRLMVRCSLGG